MPPVPSIFIRVEEDAFAKTRNWTWLHGTTVAAKLTEKLQITRGTRKRMKLPIAVDTLYKSTSIAAARELKHLDNLASRMYVVEQVQSDIFELLFLQLEQSQQRSD
jgi:hypothetical protein